MFRRIALAILLVGIAGFAAIAWKPAIAPVSTPSASSFATELVARGEVLAAAGYCATCHTTKGGQTYAGGYAMETPFGTLYSTNITPDRETGIGTWSEEAFRRAMHDGVARDGSHLFPAFPYDHFTKLTDADVSALYAYFMTRAPVRAGARENTLPFPLNVRLLQAGWKLLFFRPGRYEPDTSRSADWNRGAYLAEGISHCGACHTPRNALGAEKRGDAYAGAAIDNWIAPALTQANASPLPWNEDEIYNYLRQGVSRYHGVAAGPMSPVIHDGLAKLPDSDIRALTVYLASVANIPPTPREMQPTLDMALAVSKRGLDQPFNPAARLYTAACGTCHFNGGKDLNPLRPDLALNSAVNMNDPTNLIQVILHGVGAKEGAPGIVMPAFGQALSDSDIVRIASYLRATRTAQPPWHDLDKTVAEVRARGTAQH